MSKISMIRHLLPLALFATSSCAAVDRPARSAAERPSAHLCSLPPPRKGGYRDLFARLPSRPPASATGFAHVERSYRDSTRLEDSAKQSPHGVASGASTTQPRYSLRGTPSCG